MQTSEQTIQLAELPGIDLERGLLTTQQNHGLYIRLINKFYDKQQDFEQEFTQALAEDINDAERTAHSLKGNAGNLGMNDLFESAKTLEFACKDNNQEAINDALTIVKQHLTIVFSSIEELRKHLESSNNPDTEQDNSGDLGPLIKELYQLLSTNNVKSSSQLKKIAPLLENSNVSSMLNDIDTHIDDYEFTEAAQLVKDMAIKLNINL